MQGAAEDTSTDKKGHIPDPATPSGSKQNLPPSPVLGVDLTPHQGSIEAVIWARLEQQDRAGMPTRGHRHKSSKKDREKHGDREHKKEKPIESP